MFSLIEKWLPRIVFVFFLTASLLAGAGGRCLAQEPIWRASDLTPRGRMPQAYSQTIPQPQPPQITLSEEERQRILRLQKSEEQQRRLKRIVCIIEIEGIEKKHVLKVVPKGQKFQTGRASSTNGEGFTFLDAETQQETYFPYSEIQAVYVVRTSGENARRVGEGIGLGALSIITLPLAILGYIIGWDGC